MSYNRGESSIAFAPKTALHRSNSSSAIRIFYGDPSSHVPALDRERFGRRSKPCSRSALHFRFLFFFWSSFPSFSAFFFSAVRGVDTIQALTGAPYPHVQYGKPTKHTYDFAETMLRSRVKELHGAAVGPDIQPRLSVSDILLFFSGNISDHPASQLYDWR
jgi:hypothetical protein